MQEPYSREGNNPSSHSGSFWEREVLREVLLASYKEQRNARIWRNIWRVIGVILFLMFIASLFGDDADAVQGSGEHTAVIDLKGEIGNELDDQVEMLRTGMEAVYNNPNAKAIIIRANSPGGSPVVSNIAFNEIRRMKSEHKTFLCMWWRRICVHRAVITLRRRLTRFMRTRPAWSAVSV